MPKVYSYRGNVPAGAVYIGRPSKWGNPYLIDRAGLTRDAVIQKYREHLEAHPQLKAAVRIELRGKDLVCWCAPLPCHGDVLIEVANSIPEGAP